MPTLNRPHQNRLCIGTKPAFSFWINISTVSEVRCDCQGLGLVARIEASILVFDTKPVLYWPVVGQIQFCSFDRICKTCLDTKPVLYQGRFCSLTYATIHRDKRNQVILIIHHHKTIIKLYLVYLITGLKIYGLAGTDKNVITMRRTAMIFKWYYVSNIWMKALECFKLWDW